MDRRSRRAPEAPTSYDTLRDGEDLVQVRSGGWRLLVPLRHVERVIPAVMPAARPSPEATAPVIAIGGALVPVVFASGLFGASEVRLSGAQQMLVVRDGDLRAVLWVDAVEDVVAHAEAPPATASPGADLVLGWSGRERPLAVLDVPRLLTLATRAALQGEAA